MPIWRQVRERLGRRTRTQNATSSAISDAQYARAVAAYAGMVDRVLTNPQRRLGVDPPSGPTALPRKVLGLVRLGALGRVNPGSRRWEQLSLSQRIRWWVN